MELRSYRPSQYREVRMPPRVADVAPRPAFGNRNSRAGAGLAAARSRRAD